VTCISWNDAREFCQWLSGPLAGTRVEHQVCRLPTEAEWEYACRGGREGTRFWWGDSPSDGQNRLNLASTDALGRTERRWTSRVSWRDGYGLVAPVDSYGAKGRNGFGLADMLGNVAEWCLDGWDEKGAHEEYYRGNTSRRVVRGGSFNATPGSVRCAYRVGNFPSNPDAMNGFRVAVGVGR
jgi:formylglycine-generating enzyme